MVNLWNNDRNFPLYQKQSLRSMGMGVALFVLVGVMANCHIPLCPIKHIFGISCFGCGLTRGFFCILQFDFAAACRSHILSIPLFVGICGYFAVNVTDVILKRCDTQKIDRFLVKKYMLVFYAILLAAAYCYNHLI